MRIYVGTYAKYNAGNLFGEWLDPSDYSDKGDFIDACLEVHEDEDDPELMFQDFEGIPSCMVGESFVDESLWDYIDYDADDGAKEAYCYLMGEWDTSDFEERYYGEFDSFTELAEEILDSTGELESIPENLRYYFDYEAYGRDLKLGGDFSEHNGYYFRTY